MAQHVRMRGQGQGGGDRAVFLQGEINGRAVQGLAVLADEQALTPVPSSSSDFGEKRSRCRGEVSARETRGHSTGRRRTKVGIGITTPDCLCLIGVLSVAFAR
jgi:hypothetical protein